MISCSSISLGALPSVSTKERRAKEGRILLSGLGMLPWAVTQVCPGQECAREAGLNWVRACSSG